jgi:hypothetical protein
MIKRDYLESLIEELGALAAKALGLAKAERHDDARRELDNGYQQLGLSALVIDRLDAGSVRVMAGDKIEPLTHLLEADATIASMAGDEARARRRRALAKGLLEG